MRILYVTTIGSTMEFFGPLIRDLIDCGNCVDIATNDTAAQVPELYRSLGCRIHHVDFSRSPLSRNNLRAYHQLRRVIGNGDYDVVHCHTPVAAAVTRLVCRKIRKKTGLKVFYTAHGFHFYKGAPLKNWLIFYPLEWLCSFWTDTLITINREDYDLADRHLHARRTEFVPGVGFDYDRFANASVDRAAKRRELGVPEDAFLLVSVGELNFNKNHSIVIRALAKLNRSDLHYGIAGKGEMETELRQLADALGVGDRVHLWGYRNDVPEVLKAADVDAFPSIREGFGLAAVEGMAAGLPLICADNRGTRMYASEYERGDFSGMCTGVEMYAAAIERLADDRQLYDEMARIGPRTTEKFSVQNINRMMFDRIYEIKE